MGLEYSALPGNKKDDAGTLDLICEQMAHLTHGVSDVSLISHNLTKTHIKHACLTIFNELYVHVWINVYI